MQVTDQEANLTVIKEGAARLLPPEACEMHEGCRELQEECVELERRWRGLEQRLERNVEKLNEKVWF